MNDLHATERFSNRVENYVKYRPHYPKEIIDFLKEEIYFNSNFIVADVGSGTGILSELFINNKNTVYAIEPNTAMRLKAEELFGEYENFKSVDAAAEDTTLDEETVNFIIAGQAFHWFDATKIKKEFTRISKKNSFCALVWNVRKVVSAIEKDYELFLEKYSGDYHQVNHNNVTDEKIGEFFLPQNVLLKEFGNYQIFDLKGLEGRLLSSSYIPLEGEKFDSMIIELKQMFDKHQKNGEVKFEYITKVYLGRIA